jgi:hypothetical protein
MYERSGRKRRGRAAGLVGLNAALLVALALVTFAPGAAAQQRAGAPAAPARNPGDYTLLAGRVQGQSAAAIYILDAVNREIVGVYWDQSRKVIAPIGFRDLNVDAQAAGRSGR